MEKEVRVPKKVGAQYGNQNAKGKKYGAPKGNKYAVVTGEFERIPLQNITDEEKQLVAVIELNKMQILKDELILLTIREHRMLKRIEDLTNSPKGMNIQRIISRDGSKNETEAGRLTQIAKEHGYSKIKDILQKDFNKIADTMVQLPFDMEE